MVISWSTLEKDMFKDFDKVNLDLINPNLNNLDNNIDINF